MAWWHRLFGITVSETDKSRYGTSKKKTVKIKKERKQKEKVKESGNKNLSD